MKRIILLSVFIGLFACQSDDGSKIEIPQEPDKPIVVERKDIELTEAERIIVQRNNLFAFDLLKTVSKNEKEENNILISPLSASLALAMLNNGAGGTTHEEIQRVLGYGDISREEMNGYFQKMLKAMQEIDPLTTFKSANSIWIKEQFQVLTPFIEINKTYYDAEVRNEDFCNPATLGMINNWCSEKTEGKIPEILDEIPSDAIMYLINALYFKGIWTVQFDKSKTINETFYNQDGKTPSISMMNNQFKIYCYKGTNFTIAELPYGNEAFSMVFLLPDNGISLASVIENMNAETWQQSVMGMCPLEIPIKIPRFKIEYERELSPDLKEMGMNSMFSNANLTLINPTAELVVSKVKQKTFAEINEEGTEAAAVTVVEIMEIALPDPVEPLIKNFYVDRPFLYFIKEKSTGTIFFIGETRNLSNE